MSNSENRLFHTAFVPCFEYAMMNYGTPPPLLTHNEAMSLPRKERTLLAAKLYVEGEIVLPERKRSNRREVRRRWKTIKQCAEFFHVATSTLKAARGQVLHTAKPSTWFVRSSIPYRRLRSRAVVLRDASKQAHFRRLLRSLEWRTACLELTWDVVREHARRLDPPGPLDNLEFQFSNFLRREGVYVENKGLASICTRRSSLGDFFVKCFTMQGTRIKGAVVFSYKRWSVGRVQSTSEEFNQPPFGDRRKSLRSFKEKWKLLGLQEEEVEDLIEVKNPGQDLVVRTRWTGCRNIDWPYPRLQGERASLPPSNTPRNCEIAELFCGEGSLTRALLSYSHDAPPYAPTLVDEVAPTRDGRSVISDRRVTFLQKRIENLPYWQIKKIFHRSRCTWISHPCNTYSRIGNHGRSEANNHEGETVAASEANALLDLLLSWISTMRLGKEHGPNQQLICFESPTGLFEDTIMARKLQDHGLALVRVSWCCQGAKIRKNTCIYTNVDELIKVGDDWWCGYNKTCRFAEEEGSLHELNAKGKGMVEAQHYHPKSSAAWAEKIHQGVQRILKIPNEMN